MPLAREQNILDVFFTNRPPLIESFNTVSGISDHEAVLIKSLVSITPQQINPRKIILWNKANMPTIKETIARFSSEIFNNFPTSNPIDILWEEFKSLCSRCISFIPTKTSRNSHTKPWISSHIRRLTWKKQRLYNVAKWSNCTLKWQAYNNIKKEVQQKMLRSLSEIHLITLWWIWLCCQTAIRQQRKDNCGVSSFKHNNVLYNDDTTNLKAKLLNDYFSSVFTSTSTSSLPPLHIPDITVISIDVMVYLN